MLHQCPCDVPVRCNGLLDCDLHIDLKAEGHIRCCLSASDSPVFKWDVSQKDQYVILWYAKRLQVRNDLAI